MKQEQIIREIFECFEKQYPEKSKDYLKLINGKLEFEKQIEVYNDMLENFTFLINIVSRLSG